MSFEVISRHCSKTQNFITSDLNRNKLSSDKAVHLDVN